MDSLMTLHVTIAHPDGTFERSTPHMFWTDGAEVEYVSEVAGAALVHSADMTLGRVSIPQDLPLSPGLHPERRDGVGITETIAMVAGEAHTDQPASVSPVLGAFASQISRYRGASVLQQFLPVTLEMVGSNCILCENERARTLLRLTANETVPFALRQSGLDAMADRFNNSDELRSDWMRVAKDVVTELQTMTATAVDGVSPSQSIISARNTLEAAIEASNWLSHYIGHTQGTTIAPMALRSVGQKCADATIHAGMDAPQVANHIRTALGACAHRVIKSAV